MPSKAKTKPKASAAKKAAVKKAKPAAKKPAVKKAAPKKAAAKKPAKKAAPKKVVKKAAPAKAAPKKAVSKKPAKKAAPKKAAPKKAAKKAAPKKAAKKGTKGSPFKPVQKRMIVQSKKSPVKSVARPASKKIKLAKPKKAVNPAKKISVKPQKKIVAKAPSKPVKKTDTKTTNKIVNKTIKKVAPKVAVKSKNVVKPSSNKPVVKEVKKVAKVVPTKVTKIEKPIAEPKKVTTKINVQTQKKIVTEPEPVQIKKPKPNVRYSDKELEMFKQRIIDMRQEAIDELRMLRERLEDLNAYDFAEESMIYSMHMAEQGSEAMEKEKTYAQIQRINEYIKKLDDALSRIKDKTYGICRVCGCLIAKERLWAVPITTLSASYKIRKKCPEDGIDRIEPIKE
ncbi:MAG: hypothetical protein HZB41_05795 [Ignavibacteriae bacterium]|nr:hypothetical protein [Ignavibacteriota bacterium]